ncbi:unnamed protein product [Kuraishia capsulata CBS 1993]|uniref:Uncharacterized protein n=1 Tax=Kuraishia capsulata CBS 1993 TaxID=1382522 RepID=W6MJ26_9ASCO|nr:uncharacterized protein KUCA_T00001929001 [Kuraishia capsulata CBS 1993]CDK25958.1 unnamed protein product [Kuraishia capsulata CBS 1993]
MAAAKYLAREGVPDWLKFQIELPKYEYFDITKDRKYYDYFNDLNSDGLMFQRSDLHATSDYFRRHRVMEPKFVKDQQMSDAFKSGTNFSNYFHCPTLLSDQKISSRMFQNSCTLGDKVYSIGGMTVMDAAEQAELLGDLTDDFDLDPKLLELRFDYDLPEPLIADFIKSPFVKPVDSIQVFSCQSATLKHFPFDDESPPPLICASMCVISKHHLFMYGGFELDTDVYREGEKLIFEKKLKMNDTPWILDVLKMRFQKVKNQVHPTVSTRFPNTIARFGHGMVAIPVEEMNKEPVMPLTINELTNSNNSMRSSSKMSTPAVGFVMGGYRMGNDNKFTPINDIWKVEMFVNQVGKHNHFEFAEEIVSYPLGRYEVNHNNDGGFTGVVKMTNWPVPRGFFSFVVMGGNNSVMSHSAGSSTPDSSSINGTSVSKKLMVYGGSTIRNGNTEILGDVWWFDVSSETWTPIDGFSNLDDTTARISQFRRCGHVGVMNGDYFIVSGGVGPNELGLQYDRENAVFDIGDRLIQDRLKLFKEERKEYVSLSFNVESQMWKYAYFMSENCMTDTISKFWGVKDVVFNSIGASGVLFNGRMFFIGGILHVVFTEDGRTVGVPLASIVEINMPMLTL